MSQFSVGQVWKYKTRPNESGSRITVCGIDADDEEYGDIVHIYISDVDIPNPDAPEGKTVFIGHMPYLSEALAECVTEIEYVADALPDYEDGYELWRKAFDNSEAGVFAVTVAEAIDFVQKSIG